MEDYKINCVGMSDEQKRLVQDAFFKLRYKYEYNTSVYHYGEYYFAHTHGYITYMAVEDVRYFQGKTHTEITLNGLLKLANMEEYMTFTKADLKTGMVVKHRGGCHYSNKYNGLNLVVAGSMVQADEFGTLDYFNDDLTHEEDDCFSIVEVFEVVSAHRLEDIKNWQLKSIWKRPEQTPQQKALAELEAKQQELIDQAEKIKADILKLKGM